MIALQHNFIKKNSNEPVPDVLDVYDSWGKVGTMGVTSETGIIHYQVRFYCFVAG